MYITEEQKALLKNYREPNYTVNMLLSIQKLEKSISHAVNCESIDAKCNEEDFKLAKKLAPRVLEHLLGISGPQLVEQMTEEEQRRFFGPENRGEIEGFVP